MLNFLIRVEKKINKKILLLSSDEQNYEKGDYKHSWPKKSMNNQTPLKIV